MLSVSSMFSQDPDNHWQLGVSDVNFSTNPPSVSTIANGGNYGNASICDNSGNLLFYTNGSKVWNKNHQIMQNGNSIGGSGSSLQPAVIVPFPGNSNKYYIVNSIGEQNIHTSSTNFHYIYSIVDFTNNALGELISLPYNLGSSFNNYAKYLCIGQNPIMGNGNYKPLTVAKKSDNSGYWVIAQSGKTLLSYEISSSGLNVTPVSSTFTSSYMEPSYNKSMFRMTQDFSKLYALEFNSNPADYGVLFYKLNFNSLTGVFTNFQEINFYGSIAKYDFFELSKDDTKAYFVRSPLEGPNQPGEIVVLDLLNTANQRILGEFGNLSNLPNGFNFLQRDKYGDILITTYSSTLNRNKYFHKIENSDSYANAAIKLNWISSNNNPVFYMPQLINAIPASPCGALLITTNVTSGQDNKQGTTITASNVISSGAGAIYHAGNSVTLTSGFNAVSGSNFRAYIEGCTGVYVGKMDSDNDNFNDDKEMFDSSVRLYPNPNNGIFTIRLGNEIKGEINIAVYNLYGKLVLSSTKTDTTFDIDASDLPTGMYVVKLQADNYNEVVKFMKK